MMYSNRVVAIMTKAECEKTPRFVGTCPKCKRQHNNYYKLVVGGFGDNNHHIYIGDTCFDAVYYGHETHEAIVGTRNKTESKKPRVSSELEVWCDDIDVIYQRKIDVLIKLRNRQNRTMSINDYQRCKVSAIRRALLNNTNPAFTDLYISIMFIGMKHADNKEAQDIGIDCSTIAEGHISCYSIEALNAILRHCTSEQLAMLNDIHNGAHIHAECPRIWELGIDDRYTVFNAVLEKIEIMDTNERILKFGRDFGNYREDTVGTSHHCAINIGGEHNTVELRLGRVTDADQYTKLVKVWRGTIEIFNDNVHKVIEGAWTPEKLGQKVARGMNFELSKYQKGR